MTANVPAPDAVEEASHEALTKFVIVLFTVVPFLGVGVAAWQAWSGLLSWFDLVAFAVLYTVTIVGVTVGITACSRTAASARMRRCEAPSR
jgi:fatty-acid desaturase